MAIISETAGLLNDLMQNVAAGNPIDSDMMVNASQDIIEEIQRGFYVIRQMNRFFA